MSRLHVLVLCAVLAATTVGCVLAGFAGRELRAPAARSGPDRDVRRVVAPAPGDPWHRPSRRPVDAPEAPAGEPERVVPPVPRGAATPVLVHGRVRRDGAAVEGFDLVFEPLDRPLGSPGDWDFTGDDGRYEVELPPGSYAVRRDDDGPWVRDALVPAGLEELELDIDLEGR